ncbi:MAG: hypothetical protein JSW58_01535 [Candidatus Latescibacterota bacterium]|nr:MAG: hypothetical protein JSW58_01535 [Candidatus Latescibacterota bacterium]
MIKKDGDTNRNSKRGSDADRPLTVFQCPTGHAFFYPHDVCPLCGTSLRETKSSPDAWLVSSTTVRVNPTGAPYLLGLAQVENGAKTLCIIDEPIGDETPVVIYVKDGLYHARPRND